MRGGRWGGRGWRFDGGVGFEGQGGFVWWWGAGSFRCLGSGCFVFVFVWWRGRGGFFGLGPGLAGWRCKEEVGVLNRLRLRLRSRCARGRGRGRDRDRDGA